MKTIPFVLECEACARKTEIACPASSRPGHTREKVAQFYSCPCGCRDFHWCDPAGARLTYYHFTKRYCELCGW